MRNGKTVEDIQAKLSALVDGLRAKVIVQMGTKDTSWKTGWAKDGGGIFPGNIPLEIFHCAVFSLWGPWGPEGV